MKIRSKIERKGGTRVTMGASNYHFQPRVAGGPHIDNVTNKDHAARFLAIREGFEIAEADEERGVIPASEVPQPPMQTSATAMQAAQGLVSELLGEARTGEGQGDADEPVADESEDEDTGGEPLAHPMDAAAGDTGETEPQEGPEQPEQLDEKVESENTRELTDEEFSVLTLVLTDEAKASDEQVAAAFKVLAGRDPNARAKRETIISKTREMAVEQGFLEA